MPPVQGYTPIDLKVFGSLCTLLDATNLPIVLSPDCRNVEYLPGLVRTRPGLTSQFSTLAGIPNVNYLKTYITQLIQARLLVLDSLGNLYKENPQGTLTNFATIETPGAYANSVSLFSREYTAFGDNLFGSAIPRQYDDTNFDRVSQVGPGASPSVTSNSSSIVIDTITQPPAVVNVGTNNPIREITWTDSPGGTGVGPIVTIYYSHSSSLPDPNIYPGAYVFIQGMFLGSGPWAGLDPNGLQKITTVQVLSGNGSTWNTFSYQETANAHIIDNVPTGASYQTTLATVTTATPNTSITVGSQVSITGTSVPAWDLDWTVVSIPYTSVMNITNTALAAGVATFTYTLQTDPSTNAPYPDPTPGQVVTVFGSTNGGGIFNVVLSQIQTVSGGTFTVLITGAPNVPNAADVGVAQVSGTEFTIDPATVAMFATNPILGNSTGGALIGMGTMVPGPRQVAVSFVTDNDYITRPSPPFLFELANSNSITISNIPIGPPNIIQRILMFTPLLAANETLGSFYSIEPDFIIPDNTTTSVTLSFTDTNLLQGTQQDYLFELNQLDDAAGVTEYNSRLFWWGVRDSVLNFLNLTFDGGFGGQQAGFPGTYPLGWTSDPTYGAGGFEQPNPSHAIFGESWQIEGDGSTAIRGMITQGAYQDIFSATLLGINTSYSVRIWISKDAGMTQGNVVFDVFSPSTSMVLGTFSVPSSSITTKYQEFIGVILSSQLTIPTDLVIRLYANGTPTASQSFYIDNIDIFETLSPYLTTDVVSSQVELPENYSVDGLIGVAPENGQEVRNVFRIRNYLYIAKQSSLYVTADDGQNEPSSWAVNEVSTKVGTPSPRGVGLGDEWAVIAGQNGLYYFTGSQMTDQNKFSNEIQPTWDTINWNAAQFINVKVDTLRKRIYILAPTGSATTPNTMFVMDYLEGFADPLTNNGVGRKWTIWDITGNDMNFVLRPNTGENPLFIGNNQSNGKIYMLDSTAHNDDGVAINSYWQSGYFQQNTRMNFGYFLANVVGNGTCNLQTKSGNQNWMKVLRGWVLNANGFWNAERQIQADTSRMSIIFGTNALNEWFSMQGAAMFVQPSMWSPFRGTNASA